MADVIMKDAMKNNTHASISENLRSTRRYIDCHFHLQMTINGLSNQAALSPYHFIRVFSSVYKQTPHQYVMGRRIEKAKELLQWLRQFVTAENGK